MTHFHWPLIKKKSHKQPNRFKILRVLNKYHAFWIGLMSLELVSMCFKVPNSITNGWVQNKFQTHKWGNCSIQNQGVVS